MTKTNRDFRKFQRDLKAVFDPAPPRSRHREHPPTPITPGKLRAEKRLELGTAIVNGDLDLVGKLLKEFPEMVNKVENLLYSTSFVCALHKNIFQEVDKFGYTPLIVATRRSQLFILNFLLQIPVIDVNARSKVKGLHVVIC
jgi:hypothetical protein